MTRLIKKISTWENVARHVCREIFFHKMTWGIVPQKISTTLSNSLSTQKEIFEKKIGVFSLDLIYRLPDQVGADMNVPGPDTTIIIANGYSATIICYRYWFNKWSYAASVNSVRACMRVRSRYAPVTVNICR